MSASLKQEGESVKPLRKAVFVPGETRRDDSESGSSSGSVSKTSTKPGWKDLPGSIAAGGILTQKWVRVQCVMDNWAKGPSNPRHLLPFSQCVEAVLLMPLRICCEFESFRGSEFSGVPDWLVWRLRAAAGTVIRASVMNAAAEVFVLLVRG